MLEESGEDTIHVLPEAGQSVIGLMQDEPLRKILHVCIGVIHTVNSIPVLIVVEVVA